MSYCRWSSDNWRCDLYCYEDVSGGYTTHVAGNRIVGAIPPLRMESTEAWMESYYAQMAYLDTAEHELIGLPHDGETFNDPDLASFLARLLDLRAAGYHFPDYVLDEVRGEIAAAASPGKPKQKDVSP